MRRLARQQIVCGGLVALLALAAAPPAAAQDPLTEARTLYASAAYEDALTILNQLRSSPLPGQDRFSVEQYRAFCLLALGRSAEAQGAIEALVEADPLHYPTNADVSPRVRTAFSEVRRRILPGLVQRGYAEAKTAFDRKDYAEAADLFGRVLDLLGDPDVVHAAAQPPLADLRTLAVGFQELSAKAVNPPAPSSPPAPEPLPPPAPVLPPPPPRTYTVADTNVAPPIMVRQEMPPFTGGRIPRVNGAIEIVIDETGMVESAVMRAPVSPAYDKLALEAARTWRYQPATLDGTPVKFRKIIQILFKVGT